MKKLFLLILVMFAFSSDAQTKTDSVTFYKPGQMKRIHKIDGDKNFKKTLDSLEQKHPKVRFIIYRYIDNGDLWRCRRPKDYFKEPIL